MVDTELESKFIKKKAFGRMIIKQVFEEDKQSADNIKPVQSGRSSPILKKTKKHEIRQLYGFKASMDPKDEHQCID